MGPYRGKPSSKGPVSTSMNIFCPLGLADILLMIENLHDFTYQNCRIFGSICICIYIYICVYIYMYILGHAGFRSSAVVRVLFTQHLHHQVWAASWVFCIILDDGGP